MNAADDALRIGPAPASESYLNIEAIVGAALTSGADAVHPGYGFLSERADFARAVGEAGLIWIGPPTEVIEALGDKVAARRLASRMRACPWPTAWRTDEGDAALAEAIGRDGPAGHGQGRRRRRRARNAAAAEREDDAPDGLEAAVAGARREAAAAFGDGRLLVERALSEGRHVEVQVMFDAHGNGVPPGRARLLGAASAAEGDRGIALAGGG